MPSMTANGIHIAYETFGAHPSRSSGGRPLVLVMGLGAQRLHWPDDFCLGLAERGHFVVRFDNRDVGESSRLEDLGTPDISKLLAASLTGKKVTPPYTLADMAQDAVSLADGLDLERFHVCGASMGGMIAQTMAIRFPERIATLTSIMSTTGEPGLPQATEEARAALFLPPPETLEAYLEHAVRIWKVLGSPGFPFREDVVRARAEAAWDRGLSRSGVARQMTAIVADGSRRERLRRLSLPTLVIHGTDDPLVPLEGGQDTAAAVAGAELLTIDGMGHDLPREAWPTMIDAITRLTEEASR